MIDHKDWKQVHEALLDIARRRAGLDREELELLLAANRVNAWKQIGYGSMVEYADRVLGIDGHTLAERLRTAEKLETLPRMSEALRDGKASFSAVRELTRIATPETEGEWLEYAHGKTVRQVEQRVAVANVGDRPSDATHPDLRKRVLRFELDPETWALVVDALDRERREIGAGAKQEQALLSLIQRSRAPAEDGVAPFQVAYTICESCSRTWVDTTRGSIEVPAQAGECAACDSNVLPTSVNGAKKAAQTIPPAVRKAVIARARGRCEIPGCRQAMWKEIHHIELRSEGGTHDPMKLVVACKRHHEQAHAGLLLVERLPDGRVLARHADGTLYGEAPRPADVEAAAEAFNQLRQLGHREGDIRRVLGEIRAEMGALPLRPLMGAALQRLGEAVHSYSVKKEPDDEVHEAERGYGARPTWDAPGAMH